MTTLYRYRRSGATLADCLAAVAAPAPNGALTGYCHSPRWTRFGTVDVQGSLIFVRTPGPATADNLGQIYEARFFCEAGELRWLRDPEGVGTGQAAWVSEIEGAPKDFEALKPFTDLEILRDPKTDKPDVRIVAQERAELPGIAPGERAAYVIREYIGPAPGQAGEDGNRMVVEQRILRIAPWTGQENSHG